MLPLAPSGVAGSIARPSSQMTPSPEPGAWNNDPNPCCVFVESLCGVFGGDQVFPPSFDHDSCSEYASGSSPYCRFQCAANVPSDRARTEGTSAALMTKSGPDATTRGSDHPDGVRSANFNVVMKFAFSSQLRMARSPPAISCGEEVVPLAGEGIGSIASVHPA